MPVSDPFQVLGDYADPFNGPGLLSFWNWDGFGGDYLLTGAVRLRVVSGAANYSRLETDWALMTNRDAVVQVVGYNLTGVWGPYWDFSIETQDGYDLEMQVNESGDLRISAGWLWWPDNYIELPFNPIAHAWLRAAHRTNRVYVLASSDGTTWTELVDWPDANPEYPDDYFDHLSARGRLSITDSATGSYIEFDNFGLPNIPVPPVPDAPVLTAPVDGASVSSPTLLQWSDTGDTFTGQYSLDGVIWTNLFSGLGATQFEWDLSGLRGINLSVRLMATTVGGDSEWSDVVTFSTPFWYSCDVPETITWTDCD